MIHGDVGDAVWFATVATMLAVGFLVVAVVWVSTCGGSTTETVACGAPQRTLLALGAPTILFLGGVRAFIHTHRAWRADRPWRAWHGAGWFLLVLMVVVLTTSLSPLVGPALG